MSLAACGEANDTELVTTRTGGSKKVQDRGWGSLMRLPASHTAPQSGSGIFHRWSEFSLFAVAGDRYQEIQRENRSVLPFHKVAAAGGFPEFHGSRYGGQFFLCPYSHRKIGGSRRGYTQILRRKTKNKSPRKNSSFFLQGVVCVGVAESEKGDESHGKAQTVRRRHGTQA